jgi:NAD+ synthase (glutamine-hydrolysing)
LKINIGGATLNQTPMQWEENKQRIIYAIEYARMNGVKLLCLPEMCISGYGCEDLFLSDWLYEKALKKLLELKAFCYDISVCIGLPLKFENQNYNVVCLIQDTEIKGFYAKQFLANDGIFYETRWFKPWEKDKVSKILIDSQFYEIGDKVFTLDINNQKIRIGFEICEDAWRTIQRPAHSHFKKGVDIIINPSASNFEFGKTQKRESLVVGSSREFDCIYLYANLLGNESGKIIFDGEILIAQKGKLLAKNELLSFQDFNLIFNEVDFVNSNYNYIKEGVFKSNNELFRDAEALALYDYMRKSRSKGYVLSLSGGADSSCCAILVAEMIKKGVAELGVDYFLKKGFLSNLIGSENLVSELLQTVYQSTKNSSDDTFESAQSLAISIGAAFYSWEIDEDVKNYTSKIEKVINRSLSWENDDLVLQNIQARTRSPAIWMLANLRNALLLTTSNRSEGDVGYCTMDGDTSGSIAPIAGVDKDFVKNWLVWAEKSLGYPGLQYVNNLKPSAELRPLKTNQTDEADLMPYFILNEIELLAIREWKSPVEVYKSLIDRELADNQTLKKYIIKFFRLWSRNQWKRERLAPSFHIDTHNVDPRTWCRFPILSGGFEEEIIELEKYVYSY